MAAFFLEFADVVRPALKKTPVFVTGGFHTAAGMINAIKSGSTDGIGIGRASCEEPYLPKQLISGEVHAKVASKLDFDDFAPWLALAASQMRRVGFSMETMDSTDEKVVNELLAATQASLDLVSQKLVEGVVIPGNLASGTPKLPWENY